MSARRVAVILAAVALGASVAPAEVEDALVVVEAAPGTPGSEPSGAPPRFVLRRDGQVFVGGSSHLVTGRLEKAELAALRKRVDAARKAVERDGLPPARAAAAGEVRVRFPEEGSLEVVVDARKLQDPVAAPSAPLAALVAELLRFDHPSLVRYVPAAYALLARERALVGGCRPWTFTFPVAEALAAPVAVSADDASGWPTGALPASVCVGDKRFVVTLRPLLPGERP